MITNENSELGHIDSESEFEHELDELLDDIDNGPAELTMEEPKEVPAVNVQRPSGKQPNVKLAASGKTKGFPEGPLNIGRVSILLPDPETQKSGFYTEHAGVLVDQFPQYKFIQEKGKTQAQKTIKS